MNISEYQLIQALDWATDAFLNKSSKEWHQILALATDKYHGLGYTTFGSMRINCAHYGDIAVWIYPTFGSINSTLFGNIVNASRLCIKAEYHHQYDMYLAIKMSFYNKSPTLRAFWDDIISLAQEQ